MVPQLCVSACQCLCLGSCSAGRPGECADPGLASRHTCLQGALAWPSTLSCSFLESIHILLFWTWLEAKG